MMRTFLIVAAFCAVGLSGPAYAKDARQAPRDAVIVSHSDLDLSDPADRAVLNERLDRAVAQVCRRQMRSAFDDAAWCRAHVKARVISQSSGAVRRALTNAGATVAEARRSSRY